MTLGKRRIPKHLLIHEPYYNPHPKKHGGIWLTLALLMIIGSMLFALTARANSTGGSHAGELNFKSEQNQGPRQSLHLQTHVTANISGLIAEVTYEQTFQNITPHWQEGIYTFPLPENASVNHMEMHIGERVIIGEIKEKHAAQKSYEKAKKAGKRAALTVQQRPNLFTQKVANIPPNEIVKITLRYIQKVEFKNNQFNWMLPTTLTPRYIPGTPMTNTNDDAPLNTTSYGWALATDAVPDADAITPPMIQAEKTKQAYAFSVSISLDSGLPLSRIDALYHDIQIQKKKGIHVIHLTNKNEHMNRDFVLQWEATNESTPAAAVFTDNVRGDDYALLMLLPPKQAKHEAIARDVVFIIDTSGSMQGGSISQAKQSLALAITRLQPQDRFNIIEFNSNHSRLYSGLSQADQAHIAQAEQWVNALRADGGTEMLPALNAAFDHFSDDNRLQQIVFMTDGAVGNESQLFKTIYKNLKSARLFTVGIGSAPNTYFMRKAAEFGRGSFTYIRDTTEIADKMNTLFEKLESATSTQLKIDWGTGYEQYPEKIGDLYRGEPMLVSVKLDQLPKTVNVHGQTGHTEWHRNINIPKHKTNNGISSIWAREKIEAIEDQGITGAINNDEVKNAVVSVALTHKLLSRFTSFIAIEKEPARPSAEILKATVVPNTIAKNQTVSAVMYPKTATTSEIAWWLGLFGFVAFIIIRQMNEE